MKSLMLAAIGLGLATPAAARPVSPAMLVDRLIHAFTAKDLAGIERLTADDGVMVTQFPMQPPLRLKGKAQITAYFKAVFERYAAITMTDVVETPAADRRTITVEAKGTYRTPTGESHDVAYVWIVTTGGGKIVASRNLTVPMP